MNKHIKKLLSIALAIVMLLSAIPLTSIIGNVGFLPTAEAAATEDSVRSVINSIKKDYPHGSYFTKNGKACAHASTERVRAIEDDNGKYTVVRSNGKKERYNQETCYNCELLVYSKIKE